MEEVDTYDLLDQLRPEGRGRCRNGLKSIGKTCCDRKKPVSVEFDERIGVALSRATDFIKGRHKRESEVVKAGEVVLETARELARNQK